MTEPDTSNIDVASAAALMAAIKPEIGTTQAIKVVEAISADPVLVNNLSMEPWWQSGVGVFGGGGIGFALVVLAYQVVSHKADLGTYDWPLVQNQLVVLFGFVAVVYRRFAVGLKPLFSGWGRVK